MSNQKGGLRLMPESVRRRWFGQRGGSTVYAPGMRGYWGYSPYPMQRGEGLKKRQGGGWFPFKGLIERGVEANKKGQLGGKKQRDLKKRQRGNGLKKRQRGGVLKKRQRGVKKRQKGGFGGLVAIASLLGGIF